MPQGVAEIQNTPQVGLALIRRHHRSLDLATAGDHLFEHSHIPTQNGLPLFGKIAKKFRVIDHAVFDHLGQPVQQFGRRQRHENIAVDVHATGLIKGADQILALRDIDPGLATHRAVHLGQKGGGNLDKRDAPHVDGGQKTGDISGHPASQGDERVLTVQTELGELACQIGNRGQVLACLASGKGDELRGNTCRGQGGHEPAAQKLPDIGIRHNHIPLGYGALLDIRADLRQDAVFDHDVIGPVAQANPNCPHIHPPFGVLAPPSLTWSLDSVSLICFFPSQQTALPYKKSRNIATFLTSPTRSLDWKLEMFH